MTNYEFELLIYNNKNFYMKYKYEKQYFTELVNQSLNLSDVCRKLGIITTKGNRDTVKKYINIYKIDVSHFTYSKKLNTPFIKFDLKNILVENSTYLNTTHLKNRLYKDGLKERICEKCGQDEHWFDMKISLILDHINGINNDNRIENLRIVCPNCNAGLSTFSGKNRNNNNYVYLNNKKCECGALISNSSEKCKKCDSLSQRKVERPTYDDLINDINEIGYSATGRKYNVSDNSIRKWKKYYEKAKNI